MNGVQKRRNLFLYDFFAPDNLVVAQFQIALGDSL
jgi:hypothetical protein